MKKILMTALFLIGALGIKAQSDCVVPMMVLVPEQVDELSPMAQTRLESRLRQAVTQNGMDGGAHFSNFCLVASLSEASKNVISGTRSVVAITADLELYVGNNYTGEKFASTVVTLSGAGQNDSKAYGAVIGNAGGNDRVQKFLSDARLKINEYYETQLISIIRKAKGYALQREFEEALCLLASVPTCCSGYADVEDAMLEIYQQYIDFDCSIKIAKARAIWNAGQDSESAALAGAYLATIDPVSSCRDDALELAEQIRARIGGDWEFYNEARRDSLELEKARIEAMRAIGVAYGENQKAGEVKENWIVK